MADLIEPKPRDEAGARLAILDAIAALGPSERPRRYAMGALADGSGWYWELEVWRVIGTTGRNALSGGKAWPEIDEARRALVSGKAEWE